MWCCNPKKNVCETKIILKSGWWFWQLKHNCSWILRINKTYVRKQESNKSLKENCSSENIDSVNFNRDFLMIEFVFFYRESFFFFLASEQKKCCPIFIAPLTLTLRQHLEIFFWRRRFWYCPLLPWRISLIEE